MSAPSDRSPSFVRGLTLLGAVALVVCNMVGTSIYTLPANLAGEVGPLGILAWVITAAGYLFVALVYARLGTRFARTGGPYVFAREAFGDFAGFLVVWSYWLSATIGNAAIAFGIVGYVAGLSTLLESPFAQFLCAQAILWSLCALNVVGVRHSARLQIGVLFLNLVPLVLVAVLALFAFEPRHLEPFAPQGWNVLPLGVSLVVWAYSGVESATVPAEEVVRPERTIARGTLVGYALGTLVFLLVALAVAGAVPNEVLAASPRPIALAAEAAVGPWAGHAITFAAIVAGLGTLNGWILMSGRIPVSAAKDGLFFETLARVHPRFHTPAVALVVGTLIASALLFFVLDRSLLRSFDFVVRLAVLTTLLPHLLTAAADMLLVLRARRETGRTERHRAIATAVVAFVFVLFTIYGIGSEAVLWGFLAILAGIPLYVLFAARRS